VTATPPPDTEPEADDFVDMSVVPPTLLPEVLTSGDRPRARTLAVPSALLAEVLA
jgi:hypothetical protein